MNKERPFEQSIQKEILIQMADYVNRYRYSTTYKIVRTTNFIRYLWMVIGTDFSSKILDIYGN